jgi:hypothetical protein
MPTNADRAKAIIDSQAAKGRQHYGAGLEASALTVSEMARYAAEEAADLLAYVVEIAHRAAALQAENFTPIDPDPRTQLADFVDKLRLFRAMQDDYPNGDTEFHAACRYLSAAFQAWQAGADPLPEGTLIPMGVRGPAPDPDIPALEAAALFAAGQVRRRGGSEWEEMSRQLATILNNARMASDLGTAAAAIRQRQARGAAFAAG